MQTKNAIIEKLFTGKNFRDCISKMKPDHLQDDLKMEVILVVCEWSEEKVVKLHNDGALEFYVVRVILNLIQSTTSPFYKKYRMVTVPLNGNTKHLHSDDDIEERMMREELEDATLDQINQLYWYDAELVRIFMRVGTFRAVGQDIGIPWQTCYKTIKKALKILKGKAMPEVQPLFTKEELKFIQQDSNAI